MKAFFEEYGRTVVTVLIVLGIILVGYTIAGNGQNSAFGRFTSDVVDSLSGQTNDVLEKSTFNSVKMSGAQESIKWDDNTAFWYNGSGTKASTVEENNPMGGNVRRVTLTQDYSFDGETWSGANSLLKLQKSDGTISDRLVSGKKYKMYYYVRGQGKWLVGPEQGGWQVFSMTSEWQRVDNTFTANDDVHHAFVQYRKGDGKVGDFCDVSDVYIQEVK